MTSSLPRKCSTTELRGHKKLKNLTKKVERETGLEPATLSLEGWRSSQLSYSRKFNQPQNPGWGGEDSNLRRLSRQIYSLFPLATREPPRNFGKTQLSKTGQTPNPNLQRGVKEPFLNQLVKTGAGKGTRTPDLLITNQLLYQLSYASSANKKPPHYTSNFKVATKIRGFGL